MTIAFTCAWVESSASPLSEACVVSFYRIILPHMCTSELYNTRATCHVIKLQLSPSLSPVRARCLMQDMCICLTSSMAKTLIRQQASPFVTATIHTCTCLSASIYVIPVNYSFVLLSYKTHVHISGTFILRHSNVNFYMSRYLSLSHCCQTHVHIFHSINLLTTVIYLHMLYHTQHTSGSQGHYTCASIPSLQSQGCNVLLCILHQAIH